MKLSQRGPCRRLLPWRRALPRPTTVLSVPLDGNAETVATMEALTAAYTAAHPDVTFEIENRPGGAEGDNLVKTRLATGETGDILQYNSGSLFQALKPAGHAGRSDATCRAGQCHRQLQAGRHRAGRHRPRRAVRRGDGRRHLLQQEDLRRTWPDACPRPGPSSWPTTKRSRRPARSPWPRPSATPGPASCSCWRDYFNVQAAVPTFAADYTANKAKYATTPAAMAGFQHLEDVFKAGYLNEDFGVGQVRRRRAHGRHRRGGALPDADLRHRQHQAELSRKTSNDVGFFAQPGPTMPPRTA